MLWKPERGLWVADRKGHRRFHSGRGFFRHVPVRSIGLLTPRLILVLMWLFNSSFVLQPFAGMTVPNPVLPIAGLLLLPTTTLGFCWATSAFVACRPSAECW